jgi:hypothetical protein
MGQCGIGIKEIEQLKTPQQKKHALQQTKQQEYNKAE